MLEGFTIETEKEVRTKTVNIQSSQSKSNVGFSSSVVILRDSEEITIRDPFVLAATKGRPKSANRIRSRFEDSLSQKEVKHCKCGNCQQLGYYSTSFTLLV